MSAVTVNCRSVSCLLPSRLIAGFYPETFARPHTSILFGLHAHRDLVVPAVALVDGGIVAEDVLLGQVGGDLREGVVEIADSFGNVGRAACLGGEFLHAPFRGEIANISVVIQSGLNDINLALV